MRLRRTSLVWLPWLGVVLAAAVSLHPLLGAAPPYGDDIRLHAFRVPLINALWQNDVPYARWIPFLNYGYGSPLFNFYPPLSAYILTAVYWLVQQDIQVALNVVFGLAIFMGAAGMFSLGRHLYGSLGGLLAAALYSWSPHLLYQTFSRGSISNAIAMALFPWAAAGLIRVARRPSPWQMAPASLLIALLFLSHTSASLLLAIPLTILGLTAAYRQGAPAGVRRRRLSAVIVVLALGVGLSAFSWLPAMAEIQHTRYPQEAAKVDFHQHFVDVWRWPEPTAAGVHNPELPVSPGLAQILLGTVGMGLALARLVRRWRHQVTPLHAQDLLTLAAGLMGVGSLLLASSFSTPIWETVKPLQALQFPWRLLELPSFLLALSSGYLLRTGPGTPQTPERVQRRRPWHSWRKRASLVTAIAGLMVAFANAMPYLYPPRIETLPRQPSLADVSAVQQQYHIYGLTSWGEYSSNTVSSWPAGPLFPGADTNISLSAKLIAPATGAKPVAGDPWHGRWQTSFSRAETLTLAAHDFPGWQAEIDGTAVPLGHNKSGMIQLQVPAGEHTVEVSFGRTPVRWLADGVTAASALLIAGLFFAGLRGDRQPASPLPDRRSRSIVRLPAIIALLILLLSVKLLWIDRVNNRLVVHPQADHIATTIRPEYGSFNDEIQLVGYQVQEPDQLTLFWQALAVPKGRYTVQVMVIDARGTPVRTLINETPGFGLTSRWEPGRLTRDRYTIPVELVDAPVGYYLYVSLQESETGEMLPLSDAPWTTAVPAGRIKRPPAAAAALPPSVQAVGTRFGELIELSQIDLPSHVSGDEPIDFTLYWRALAPIDEDYTVFIHLLNRDGSLAAGRDSQPLAGVYPTSFWAPGETIADQRRWLPEVAPGSYQLQIGLYRLDSGARLVASGPHSELGDRVIIETITVDAP